MSVFDIKIKKSSDKYIALIDADVLRYRIGFAAQQGHGPDAVPEPIENALHSCKLQIEGILERLDTSRYKLFLTGRDNFRDKVATSFPYKGNRTATKPYHYENLTQYMIERWDAEVIDGMEADDALGIHSWNYYRDLNNDPTDGGPVICSIDKDLDMIPGWHYNFVKDNLYWVTLDEGMRFFYNQLIAGDRTDNIIGIRGYGMIKAEKHYQKKEAVTERQMYEAALELYEDEERLLENARLLWILREAEQVWSPPPEE